MYNMYNFYIVIKMLKLRMIIFPQQWVNFQWPYIWIKQTITKTKNGFQELLGNTKP